MIYYVKNGGNDLNSGISDAEAWANHPFSVNWSGIENVLSSEDTVLMKCGDIWEVSNPEQALLTCAINRVTTANYGTGDLPKLKILTESNYPVIYADGKSELIFDGLHIEHHDKTFNSNENRCGILLDGTTNPCHDVAIKNCKIKNIPYQAVRALKNCYNIFIGNVDSVITATENNFSNELSDFGYAGIGIEGSNPLTGETNVKIIHNYIHDSSRLLSGNECYGIYLSETVESYSLPNICDVSFNYVKNILTWEAIDTHGGYNLNFKGNKIYGFGSRGFTVGRGDNINIESNIIIQPVSGLVSGNEESFIKVISETDANDGVTIKNNECYHDAIPLVSKFSGIQIYNATNILISGNEIKDLGAGGKSGISLTLISGSSIIDKNFIRNCGYSLYLSGADIVGTIMLANNIFSSYDKSAIYINGALNALAELLIYNNALYITEYVFVVYANNGLSGTLRIKNNTIGVKQPYTCQYIYILGSIDGVFECDYNSYFNGTGFYISGGSKNLAEWKSLGHDVNSPNDTISLNPDFTNTGLNYELETDFVTLESSPCRLAGMDVTLTDDYSGNPVNTPPDIGAFQS